MTTEPMNPETVYMAFCHRTSGTHLISPHRTIEGAIVACERQADSEYGGASWRDSVQWEMYPKCRFLDFGYYNIQVTETVLLD